MAKDNENVSIPETQVPENEEEVKVDPSASEKPESEEKKDNSEAPVSEEAPAAADAETGTEASKDPKAVPENETRDAGDESGEQKGVKGGRKRPFEFRRGKAQQPKAPAKSKEQLHEELIQRKNQLVHTTAEMSAKLKNMLADEIESYKKREKRRSAEILAVFANHNFYANGFTPEELRTTLEDLGPTYVKIGQIMSSRVDMLPEEYCRELEKLRQNVKPLDPEIAKAVIEQESGKKIDEIFSEFRDEPLGSASIGQAHYGVLKDGRKVVTKVQRPLIAEMMRKDFVLLKKLAGMIGAMSKENEDGENMVDLISVIDELEKVTEDELDFRIEAENTRFFRENCITDPEVVNCPEVIDELTTERIFTMTFVDGYSVSKKDRLIADGYDPNAIGKALLENYVHQIMDVGTFHADPHQGNIMVSHGIPYWIDFGMIGRITDADINEMQALILAMMEADVETMTNAVMSLGAASPKTNRTKLMEDIDVFYGKYMNVTALSDIDMADLLEEVTEVANKNHVSMPGKFTMLVRSVASIEGVIEQLCPDLNLFKIISDKMMERAKKSFDLSKSMVTAGKDALEMGKKTARIPILASDLLNNALKGRMKINLEMTGYEDLVKKVSSTVRDLMMALFACVIFIGSCMLAGTDLNPQITSGMPLIAAAGFVLSIALGIYALKSISKK